MRTKLLLMLAVTSSCFALPAPDFLQESEILNNVSRVIDKIIAIAKEEYTVAGPLNEIKYMLQNEAVTLNTAVINKVLMTLKCAKKYNIEHNNILTIIDYSLPSSEKRLWVFDLKIKQLLFHTYVSHGIKSGTALSNYFSNKNNSKASSIGVFKTEKTYHGRDGLSLKLDGLDKGFNDNAFNRYVVIHGGWYVDEDFIKKYGRAGRSWGCPALPLNLASLIINAIKDESLFVVYYPSDNWFLKSKFLNCENAWCAQRAAKKDLEKKTRIDNSESREDVLFANIKSKHTESDPIVVMAANRYQDIFHSKAPLERMLRRQINNMEYIALSNTEFKDIVTDPDKEKLNAVLFVIPVVKMQRGYYETQMKIVNLGKIKDVRRHASLFPNTKRRLLYRVDFEARPSINLRATNQFIRWLGL